LQDLLRDLFFQSYGDRLDSKSGDVTITGNSWQMITSASNGSVFFFRNLSEESEVQITWSREAAIGMRIPPGESLLIDNVSGVVYAKPSVSTDTVKVNFGIIAKNIND